jgi:hypothetical protein
VGDTEQDWSVEPDPKRTAPPAWRLAPSVDGDEAVPVVEAKQMLGLRTDFIVNHRAATAFLVPCWDLQGRRCVTRASIEKELSWWTEAGFLKRLMRRLTYPLYGI